MSPQDEYLLLHDVVPRLRSAIRIAVAHVGSEDDAELLQDGTVMAAKILTNATRKGKRVTASNVAFYTLQHMESGHRTVGYSGVDVLASGTQLNGRATVSSIHEEVPMCGDTNETVPVCELMSRDEEDPSTKATRKLDWLQFYRTQDRHGRRLLNELVCERCDVPPPPERNAGPETRRTCRQADLGFVLVSSSVTHASLPTKLRFCTPKPQ